MLRDTTRAIARIGASVGLAVSFVSVSASQGLPPDQLPAPPAAVVSTPEKEPAQPRANAPETRGAATAAPAQVMPRRASSGDNAEFNLMNGERLFLRVRGNSEFSGEYRVASDGRISIPGLGRIVIAGHTPSEFEELLSDRLSAALRRDISVSVEVTQYKPFFMTGHVTRPGSLEWQPGLTVLKAISLAGGIARGSSRGESEAPERAPVIEQTQSQLRFSLAQLARLVAEKEGKATIETTRVFERLLATLPADGRHVVIDVVMRQNELLAEQREYVRTRVARLEAERELATEELAAAQGQEAEIRKQLDISKQLMASSDTLKKQGLVPTSKHLSQQREVIDSNVRLSESRTIVQRARGRVITLGQEIAALKQERRAMLNERIESLEREVSQLDATLRDAGVVTTGVSDASQTPTYTIARKSTAGVQMIQANVFSEVLAGDVIVVSHPGSRNTAQLAGFSGGLDQRASVDRIRNARDPAAGSGIGMGLGLGLGLGVLLADHPYPASSRR